jgi:hypothetical protein
VVNGSSSYSATKIELNPGLPVLPWLSPQAKSWEKYRWNVTAHYVPSNAVTTTPGKIYLAADYDPVDAAPSTQAAISAYETQSNEVVHKSLSLPISTNRMFDGVQRKKVRCGPVGGDLQLYDGCSLIVATVNCNNTDPIGELFLEYEIELISPQIEPSIPVPPGKLLVTLASSQSLTTTVPAVVNFDTAEVEGMPLVETDGAITLPCGTFLVSGIISPSNTANELTTIDIEMKLDSASLSPVNKETLSIIAGASGSAFPLPVLGIVRSDGTNVLSIVATVTGAAGTLSISATKTRLLIEAL